MRQAWIISVGTELTLGQTVDTNTAWLAAQLASVGVRTRRHVTVPDELDALGEAVTTASRGADLVLCTGGLGPTEDDLTRVALARAAGVELVRHEPSVEMLRSFFAARNRAVPEQNLVQADLPRGATPLPNTCGTAPGVLVSLRGTPVYALPGVPFEMREMFKSAVLPAVRAAAEGAVLVSRMIHTFGAGESDVGRALRDLMERGRNPEVGTTAAAGIVSVRINASAGDANAAGTLLDATEDEVRRRLGTLVFGRDDETLAGTVGKRLQVICRTVATAESCTGGLLGKLLTDVSGSSAYYVGGVVSYANAVKVRQLGVDESDLSAQGAVSEAVANAMARGVAERLAADYALAVTGVAGPTGGTADKPVGLVWIGLHTPEGTTATEYRFGETTPREIIRRRAARTALNMLRMELLRVDGSAR